MTWQRVWVAQTHEFIKFLNAVERSVPVGKVIYAILDNYATRKHPKVRQWLVNHQRWVLHSPRYGVLAQRR